MAGFYKNTFLAIKPRNIVINISSAKLHFRQFVVSWQFERLTWALWDWQKCIPLFRPWSHEVPLREHSRAASAECQQYGCFSVRLRQYAESEKGALRALVNHTMSSLRFSWPTHPIHGQRKIVPNGWHRLAISHLRNFAQKRFSCAAILL